MSRRSDKAWEQTKNAPTNFEGGGEEYFFDWHTFARDVGLDIDNYEMGDYHEQTSYIDTERLMEDAKRGFLEGWPISQGQPHLIAYIVIHCGRCERRLDRIILLRTVSEASRLGHHAAAKTAKTPPQMRALRADLAGSGPLTYKCECGRSGLQVSRSKVGAFFKEEAEKDWIVAGNPTDQRQDGVWFAERLRIDA